MRNRQVITDSVGIDIVNDYENGLTQKQVAIKHGVSRSSVRNMIRKFNGSLVKRKKHKYSINEDYFNTIDTEEKAYFLGWLFADGCNHIERSSVDLEINAKDDEILNKLLLLINSNQPIFYREKFTDKTKTKKNKYARISFYNRSISRQLYLYGCTNKKSLSLEFPSTSHIPEHLIRHFIRGYFDGDGGISFGKSENGYGSIYDTETVTITSSLPFCAVLYTLIRDLGPSITKYKKIYRVILTSNEAYNFLKWIYQDSCIHLERKYQQYLQMDQRFKNKVLGGESI